MNACQVASPAGSRSFDAYAALIYASIKFSAPSGLRVSGSGPGESGNQRTTLIIRANKKALREDHGRHRQHSQGFYHRYLIIFADLLPEAPD